MPLYLWWAISLSKCKLLYTNIFLIDAIPKKRGPKTDVLEALLKRVDGLERKLRDEKQSNSPNNDGSGSGAGDVESLDDNVKPKRPHLETTISNIADESAIYSPTSKRYENSFYLQFTHRLTHL